MTSPAHGFGSRRVFIDTGAYYALASPRELDHDAARRIMERLIAESWHLFTTNFILAETHALTLSRLGRDLALRVLTDIERSSVTIVRVSAGDERRAREILVQYDDKNFSLTDAISFGVMERLRIPQAFTFDHNFAQYGVTVLRP
jgi:uncharacterized protein